MPGEFDFIDWIRSQQTPSALVSLPAGDDMAVLRWPADDLLLVGADQVLDGVHFDSAVHAPRQIGAKVMNRNLSDCAAMACLPAAAVATVALPRGRGLDYAKALYLGLRAAADPFDCQIIGGDTASWDGPLVLSVTILGRSAGIAPVTHKRARSGDGIYVTGPLGGSILGRHMTFAPRIQLARQLAAGGSITAMIDISDGLSRDLGHICSQSGVGAVIDAATVPIHPDAETLSWRDSIPALDHALHDGEDHELLFTSPVAPSDQRGTGGPPVVSTSCTRIGTIIPEPGIWLQSDGARARLEPKGWQHGL